MILVSACLCGCRCTYRGDDNRNPVFVRLYHSGQAVPVCPEQLGGLPVPRPASEIRGGDGSQVLKGQALVFNTEGVNVTRHFIQGARNTLAIAREVGAALAVLKARSPSCGVGQIYDGTFSRNLQPGDGVTAALLRQNGIEIVSDEEFLTRKGVVETK